MIRDLFIAFAAASWIWLIREFLSEDGFFDQPRERVCLGCQRYRFVPGCPVHDPEERRSEESRGLRPEAVSAHKEKGSS